MQHLDLYMSFNQESTIIGPLVIPKLTHHKFTMVCPLSLNISLQTCDFHATVPETKRTRNKNTMSQDLRHRNAERGAHLLGALHKLSVP